MMKSVFFLFFAYAVKANALNATDSGFVHRSLQRLSSLEVVKFYAVGDGPRGNRERLRFPQQVDRLEPRPDFMVHLGNLKEREMNCNLSSLRQAASAMRQHSKVPTFIVPGEADWYYCTDQEVAWNQWSDLFLNFEDNWNHPFTVKRQRERPENFSFLHQGVLFVSFHILSAAVLDWAAWNQKVQDDVVWLERELVSNAFADDVAAVVLLAHTSPHARRYREFYASLVHISSLLEKPLLYLHGGVESFQMNRDLGVNNILRVGVGPTGNEDPLEVTIDPYGDIRFLFRRRGIP
jgi:hypothetical protein